jgi:hypothetical protein
MNNYESNSLIYPSNYDELAESRARKEERSRQQELAQALTGDLATVAFAACIGIAGPEYKKYMPAQPTVEQSRKFGRASLSSLVSPEDRPSFLTSIEADQYAAVNEQAVLGYANRQAA